MYMIKTLRIFFQLIFSKIGFSFSRALIPTVIVIYSQFAPSTVFAERLTVVCHGEYEFKCKAHFYQIFEHCGDDNGVSGANPNVSGPNLCGKDDYLGAERADGGSIGGNHCGYSWYV